MQPEDKILILEEIVICSDCKEGLKPILENNGFEPPDPTHFEIVGYENCKCQ